MYALRYDILILLALVVARCYLIHLYGAICGVNLLQPHTYWNVFTTGSDICKLYDSSIDYFQTAVVGMTCSLLTKITLSINSRIDRK